MFKGLIINQIDPDETSQFSITTKKSPHVLFNAIKIYIKGHGNSFLESNKYLKAKILFSGKDVQMGCEIFKLNDNEH